MPGGRAHVLLIDDDRELTALLIEYLGGEGMRVEAAHDGARGLERARSGDHDLVVLDVMIPGDSGFEILRRLRASSAIPVIMLTARGSDVDRIVGLEIGADDYLGKPFNPRELVARIGAVLRRATARDPANVLREGSLTLERSSRTVRLDGVELELTSAEHALLEALLASAGEVVSRESLSEPVLGRRWSPTDRSLDVHLSHLRRKLGPEGARIKTVRGHGYLFARTAAE